MIVVEGEDAGPEDKSPHRDDSPFSILEAHFEEGGTEDEDSAVFGLVIVAGDILDAVIIHHHGEEVTGTATVGKRHDEKGRPVVLLPFEHDSCEVEAGKELAESGEDDAGLHAPAAAVSVSHCFFRCFE